MGSGGSTHRMSYELDENQQVTVVKGIKLSEHAVRRMKEPNGGGGAISTPTKPQPTSPVTQAPDTPKEEPCSRQPRENYANQEWFMPNLAYSWGEEEKRKLLSTVEQLKRQEEEMQKLHGKYRKQFSKWEEKSTTLHQGINEDFRRNADRVEDKIPDGHFAPVCAELQDRVLTCYLEHAGQSLNCSTLARQYVQCVNAVKQELLGKIA
uniref:MICOS complex subunit Mic19-like n=1 Tax=Myxine glutinosa TaxID=7769 RepID=UPI00358F462F